MQYIIVSCLFMTILQNWDKNMLNLYNSKLGCNCVTVNWGVIMLQLRSSYVVNHFTVGNPLFWENFLLPECLRDSIV